MIKFMCTLLFLMLCNFGFAQNPAIPWNELASPEVGALWVQPSQGKPAQAIWGHSNGMRVGLAPMPGPYGLLRIYTPYLGLEEGQMLNFIAVEPIPSGMSQRGFSELEMSGIDNRRGKKFWSANDSLGTIPGRDEYPARGIISNEEGVQTLTVFIFVEPFTNGAKVYVRLRFYADQPYEVEIATFAENDSRKLENCIVTATMGNLARLRTLYFANYTKTAAALWPDYSDDDFAPQVSFSVKDMIHDKKRICIFHCCP